MTQVVEKKVMVGFEMSKVIIGLIACWGMFYFAGKLEQKVDDHDRRLDKIEFWKDNLFQKYENKNRAAYNESIKPKTGND